MRHTLWGSKLPVNSMWLSGVYAVIPESENELCGPPFWQVGTQVTPYCSDLSPLLWDT